MFTQPTRHTLELSLDWRQVSYTSKEMSQIRDQQVKRSQGLPSTPPYPSTLASWTESDMMSMRTLHLSTMESGYR